MERRTLHGWRRVGGAAAIVALALWSHGALAWMIDSDRAGFDAAAGALGYGETVERQFGAGRPADATLGRFTESRGSGPAAGTRATAPASADATASARRSPIGSVDLGRWHGSLSIHPGGAAGPFAFTFEKPADLLNFDATGARGAPCTEDDPGACAAGSVGFLDGRRMPVPLPQGFGQLLVPGSRESDRLGQVNFDLRDRRTDLLTAAASSSIDVIRRSVMIPEPGTLSLLGAGALALLWLGRRRR